MATKTVSKETELIFQLVAENKTSKTIMSFGTDYYVIKFNGLKINTLTMYSYRRLIGSLGPT